MHMTEEQKRAVRERARRSLAGSMLEFLAAQIGMRAYEEAIRIAISMLELAVRDPPTPHDPDTQRIRAAAMAAIETFKERLNSRIEIVKSMPGEGG